MSYRYEDHRDFIFSDEGQRVLLKMRDAMKEKFKTSGAVMCSNLMTAGIIGAGDSWELLACVDRLVELGDMREVPNPWSSFAQHRIFVSPTY